MTNCDVIYATGQALSDVSKDKVAARQVESNTTQFTKALENVETGLLKQINYLTTVSTGFWLRFLIVVKFILFSNLYILIVAFRLVQHSNLRIRLLLR